MFAIAVKTPLYPFHLWLYRAHAEAPVAGSVLLAGVVLKMASYAFIRIPLGLYSETTYRFLPFLLTLSLVTLLLSSLSVSIASKPILFNICCISSPASR
ncbi:MAG: hypothetical protein EOO61_09480, partial [Hymenobacter sp.]